MATKVLVLETFADEYVAPLKAAFPDLDVRTLLPTDPYSADVDDAEVLVCFGIDVTDELMRRAGRLRWIQSLATGVDHFLKTPELRKEVVLTSGRGIHGPPMREQTAFLMLSLSHDAQRLGRDRARAAWDRTPWPLLIGKTAVVVGVGVASTAIAELLKAFGMHTVGVTRTPRATPGFDEIVTADRLHEVAARADYLINVLPGGPDNTDRYDRALFAAMKPSAFFVNVGRGEAVDEAALIEALETKRIAGAGLDVFRTEPLPAGHPFWTLSNVVMTPHTSGRVVEYTELILPLLLRNMGLFLAGRAGEMENLVPH
jgi:phosphoglycerate dehydrogenase-like enzyme